MECSEVNSVTGRTLCPFFQREWGIFILIHHSCMVGGRMLVSLLLISLHIIRSVYMDVKMQRDRLFTSLVMLSCIEEAKKTKHRIFKAPSVVGPGSDSILSI